MRLVNSKQMQAMDHYTIENVGIPGLVLMENAARSWVDAAEPWLKKGVGIFIFCGSGNNGGDGYAIARILKNMGYQCTAIAVKEARSEDCKKNAAIWERYGETKSWEEFFLSRTVIHEENILIDAILGTGIDSEIHGTLRDIIDYIDNLSGIKLAVDIPSGICSSTGDKMGVAIRAKATITFQREKIGHHLYPGKSFSGELICQKISILEQYNPDDQGFYLIDQGLVEDIMPKREADGYKNQYGHLATWCGSVGMMGAALMCSRSGLKSGVGLLTAAVPGSEMGAFLSGAPELMTYAQEKITRDWFDGFDAVVVGCGLGRDPELWKTVEEYLMDITIPVILDADAFSCIKQWDKLPLERMILTPHPGEFSRLSGFPKPANNRERVDQAIRFVAKHKTTLILKGAPVLVVDADENVYINSTGNVGMATAGSGDVLAGIVGSLVAQGLTTANAAILGTWVHGKSGDLARREHGEMALTATNLVENLGRALMEV